MLRVFALPSADQAWALRELDSAAAAATARASSLRLAELNAARAALCRQPLFVVSAGEVELARGAWRLCALGVSIEVTTNGRTRALLLNSVLVGSGHRLAAPPRARFPAAEPSLQRFASMAAALPPTPPATPAGRTLRRTRSGDLLHQTHRADAPPPPPPQRRLRSAGGALQIGEAVRPRAMSPLFSFRCPITHALMEDPVVAADGHSYERSAIARWLLRSQRSPCTNVAMAHTRVLPNHSLRAAIAEWRATAVATDEDTAEATA